MATPTPSKLDIRQIFQNVHDEASGTLRTTAQAVIANADIAVQLDSATGDNVAIKSLAGNELKIETNGSINVNAGTNLNTSALALENGGHLASVDTKTPVQGQALMTTSTPVVIASNQSNIPIYIGDSPSRDSFGRLRVSEPTGIFDSQFTYDLQPLLYEQIVLNTGATISHDSVNRNALISFAATPTGGKSIMQSFQYHRYQPGKSQKIEISFNFISQIANCLKFVGYSDGINGVEFQNNGTTNQIVIYSGSTNGNQLVTQANWNLDKLDGTGSSGFLLDITKAHILIIDMQALYTGRVRVGFDCNGAIVYCHQFIHSNSTIHPYIQNASLPIRAGMTNTGTVTTTMKFTCCTVISEGGTDKTIGFEHTIDTPTPITIANGAKTHILSFRPKQLFNGIINRASIVTVEINILNSGTNHIYWELVLGQAITGNTTFTDVNTTYSSTEYNILGTISGSPSVEIDSGYAIATNQIKGSDSMILTHRYPITLDAAGLARLNGTLSIVATGLGGTSTVYAVIKWIEVR